MRFFFLDPLYTSRRFDSMGSTIGYYWLVGTVSEHVVFLVWLCHPRRSRLARSRDKALNAWPLLIRRPARAEWFFDAQIAPA